MESKPTVQQARFIEEPKSQVCQSGETVTFTAHVAGEPTPSVQWNKGKYREIKSYGRFDIKSDGDLHTLSISVLDAPDTGMYRCVASNSAGESSVQFDLTVAEKKPKEHIEQGGLKKTIPIPKEELDVKDILDLMKEVDPKEYEKYARYYGITDYRQLLTRCEELKTIKDDKAMADEIGDLYQLMTRSMSLSEHVEVISDLCDVTADVGTEAKFETELKLNFPDIEVNWYKGNDKIATDDKYEIKHDGQLCSLTVKNVALSDAGEVRVVAGPHSSTVQLIARPKVFFSKELEDKKAKDHQNAEFVCVVNSPDAVITWYKSGNKIRKSRKYDILSTPVDGGIEHKLIVKDMQPEVESVIMAKAVMGNAKAETSAKLMYSPEAIIFTQELEAIVKVNEGQSTTLTCKVSRDRARVQWLRNGKKLKPGPLYKTKISGLERRLINDVTRDIDDGAEFSCRILDNDELTETTSRIAVVSIGDAIVKEMKDQTVVEGKKATFECLISRDDGKVTWYAGDSPISGQDKKYKQLAMKNLRRLIVNDATMDDIMTYSCTLGDLKTSAKLEVTPAEKVDEVTTLEKKIRHIEAESEPELEQVQLKGIPGLKFVKELEDSSVVESESATLECELSHPNVAVEWFTGNQKIYQTKQFTISAQDTIHKLVVSDLQDNQAKYKCQAVPNPDVITTCTVSMKKKVEFKDRLATEEYGVEGGNVMFRCSLNRSVETKWLYNNRVIQQTNGKYKMECKAHIRTLLVQNLTLKDQGTYSCQSLDGAVETTCDLTVGANDVTLLQRLKDVSVVEGETASFEAEISDARPHCTWMLDDEVLEKGENVEIIEEGRKRKLLLKNVTSSQRGKITMSVGRIQTGVSLSVIDKPVSFTEPLKDKMAMESGEVTFQCKISKPEAQVKWIRDRRIPIQNCDKYEIKSEDCFRTLVIRDVTYDDEVTYTCDVEDCKTTAKLTVSAREVKFVSPLSDQTVPENSVATFQCQLNFDDVKVTWYKNNVRLAKSRDVIITSKGAEHSITFNKASSENEGRISIEAENLEGTAELRIETEDLELLKGLENVAVVEGDNVTMICQLNKANIMGSWFRNGIKLARTDLISIRTEGTTYTLVVKNLSVDDAAEFTFSADGVQSTSMVTVEERPVMFTKKLQPVTVTEMDVIELSCEVSRPHGKVTWYKGEDALEQDERIEFVEEGCWRRLVILRTKYEDEAEYICKCEAGVTSAAVTVGGRNIKVRRDLRDIEATEGQCASFECEISHDDVAVRWYLNGDVIKSTETIRFESIGRRHRLIFDDVTQACSGTVRFVASKASSEATLNVMEPLVHFVETIKDLVIEEKSQAVFECQVSRPNAEVRWYKGRAIIRESEKYDVIVDGCRRALVVKQCNFDDEKKYTCDADDARTSAKLTVQSRNIKFVRSLPETFRVIEREPITFEIELTHCDVEVNWYKNGAKMSRTKNVDIENEGPRHFVTIHHATMEDYGVEVVAHAEEETCMTTLYIEGN